MADDPNKKKLAQLGMVPPPPPILTAPPDAYPPPPGTFSGGPGAVQPNRMMNPIMDTTPPAAQVNVPQPLSPPTSSVDPSYFANLLHSADQQRQQADSLEQAYQKFQPAPLPTAPQLSPFEQNLDKAMQDKMTALLTKNDSIGDRFTKGYNVGQKLAANILVPLMGTFSKHAGTAIGAAEATQGLKAQSMENDRNAAAEKAARNATLAQMSQMWENMSPASSKNLMALASARLAAQQKNQEQQHQALKDALEARHDATTQANTVLGAAQGMSKEDWQKAKDVNESQFKAAGLQSEIAHRGQEEKNEDKRIEFAGNQDKRSADELKLQKDQASLGSQKFSYEKAKDVIEQGFKGKQQQIDAAGKLNTTLNMLDKDSQSKNVLGQSKFGEDMLDRVAANPARMQIFETLAKQAGVKTSAKDIMDAMRAKQAVKSSANDNWLSGNPVFQGLQALAGGGTKDAMPAASTAQAADPRSAIEAFYAKNGRKPTLEELKAQLNGGK